jgi:thymidine phosphorylase
MVASLGGPKRLLDDPWQHLERAPVELPVLPTRSGTVRRIDCRAVGMTVVALGGGRTRPQDDIDHAVGLTALAGLGEVVGADRPLAVVHARTRPQAEQAAAMVRAAYVTSGRSATANPVVIDRVMS